MSPANPGVDPSDPSPSQSAAERAILILTTVGIVLGLLAIPISILSLGYEPWDDALRHVSKAVCHKAWTQILVTDKPYNLEITHVGWHWLLGWVHQVTGWNNDGLLSFAIFLTFAAFALTPLFFLSCIEAWPISLLILALVHSDFRRLLLGRPFILGMAALLALLFLWPELGGQTTRPLAILITVIAVALASWIHTNWYLFAIPVLAFFLSRRWRAAGTVLFCVIAGVCLGACLTGHPVSFLVDTLLLNVRTLDSSMDASQLVGEYQPIDGDIMTLSAVGLILVWRRTMGRLKWDTLDNPVFIMAAICWILGFKVGRFWYDWGIPAVAVWICLQFEAAIRESPAMGVRNRGLVSAFVILALYGVFTHNRNGRWTTNLQFVPFSTSDPLMASWLPDEGGIVYSNSEAIFQRMFFQNPYASWRYATGYEQTLMLPENLAVFREIDNSHGALGAFLPWARKLRPADRIIALGLRRIPPGALGLEWCDFRRFSIGRRPRAATARPTDGHGR